MLIFVVNIRPARTFWNSTHCLLSPFTLDWSRNLLHNPMWNMAVNNISYPIYPFSTRTEKGYITKMIPFFFCSVYLPRLLFKKGIRPGILVCFAQYLLSLLSTILQAQLGLRSWNFTCPVRILQVSDIGLVLSFEDWVDVTEVTNSYYNICNWISKVTVVEVWKAWSRTSVLRHVNWIINLDLIVF